MLISVQTCLVDRINNVFPSRSLYGVSLWRNKVLTGSVPFAFRETRFRRLYIFLLLVACRLIFFLFPTCWNMFVSIMVINYVQGFQIYLYVVKMNASI